MPKILKSVDNNVVGTEAFSLASTVGVWQIKKWEAAKMAADAKTLNEKISSVIEELGEEDNKGHRWLNLPRAVQGYDTKGRPTAIKRLQRQRRVSTYIDEDTAVEILDRFGALDGVAEHWVKVDSPDLLVDALKYAAEGGFKPIQGQPEIRTEIDKEALEAALDALAYEDKITKEELDKIKTESVTWALYAHE